MGARLIDSTRAFRPVYSIFRHEYLGCLLSAHVVQELDNGRLSLSHQGLHPGNYEQFRHELDDVDRKLIQILAPLSPQHIMKKFGPKARNEMDFYTNKFKGEAKKMILAYINRIMNDAIGLLADREIYTMGNDGYPAHRPVEFIRQPADLVFNFLRDNKFTRYFPTITLFNRPIGLQHPATELVVRDPAWLLHKGRLFTFGQDVEGIKLQPFFKKDFIEISKSTEETYFRKFVPQIIERYPVKVSGLDIIEVQEEPQFQFVVDLSAPSAISMELRVHYGGYKLKVDPTREATVVLENKGGNYQFITVARQPRQERDMLQLIEGLHQKGGHLNWEFMAREEGLKWLGAVVPVLTEMGVKVVQQGEEKLNFDRPKLEIVTTEEGDWFDIKAVVTVGGFSIPFLRFKQHILRGKRDFTLPDGSVAILPESWFSDYRHLVEIADEKDEDTLRLKNYQMAVLDMKEGGHGLGDKMNALSEVDEIPDAPTPTGLRATLRSYQKKGYDWLGFLRNQRLGGILADDMGLGKTLQTLTLLQSEKEIGEKQPSLIVMPTSLVYNWKAEARKFTPDLKILIHTGSNRTKNPANFTIYDIILTTYGIVRQDIEILKEFPFHYVILDESQMIKNPASKTAKAMRELAAKHRLSLTGTPLENTLMDLWSQMNFLNPGLLGSERFFKNFYAQPIEKKRDVERQVQLKRLIHPFILRRTKEQVAHELPPKVEQRHYCEMTTAQKRVYEKTKNAYRNYLLNLEPGEFRSQKLGILAGLQKLRQIAIHPGLVEEGEGMGMGDSGKYQEFRRLLEEVLAKDAKVLVFSQFVRLLRLLEAELKKEDISYSYLDGSTKDRQGQVQRFQENESVKVFLISLKAGGVGLNLTAAEYVFILDPWWNPAVEAQAVDRSHRIGQEKTVFSYKFITRDSIEEKIVKLQERKRKLSSDIVSVEDDIFKSLKKEDFEDLLA